MVIKVVSYIPYLENIKDEYRLEKPYTIVQFLELLGAKWDDDALVVVNRVICNDRTLKLKDGDKVELLIPIAGG